MWCSWPCSVGTPSVSETPSDVPKIAASESWVAIAFPAKATSTQPERISAQNASTEPVCTTAGPSTHRIFLPLGLHAAHRLRDPLDHQALWLLRGNLARHEREGLPAAAARPLERVHLDRRRGPQTIRSPATTSLIGMVRARRPVDDDAAVHLGVLDPDPFAGDPDLGGQVRRRVEALSGKTPSWSAAMSSTSPVSGGVAPRSASLSEQPVEHLPLGADLDPREGRVVVALADLEGGHPIVGAGLDDLVEDPRQDQRVDDVAADLDDSRSPRRASYPQVRLATASGRRPNARLEPRPGPAARASPRSRRPRREARTRRRRRREPDRAHPRCSPRRRCRSGFRSPMCAAAPRPPRSRRAPCGTSARAASGRRPRPRTRARRGAE